MGFIGKYAAITGMFVLVVSALVTPIHAGLFDDFVDGTKQVLKDTGTVIKEGAKDLGNLPETTNKGSEKLNSALTSVLGEPPKHEPPTFKGVVGRTVRYCFKKDANGGPSADEKPTVYPIAEDPYAQQSAQSALRGSGGTISIDVPSALVNAAHSATTSCLDSVKQGLMHPVTQFGQNVPGNPSSGVKETWVSVKGIPAEDGTGDRLVIAAGYLELRQYGPNPIVRWNPDQQKYKPLQPTDITKDQKLLYEFTVEKSQAIADKRNTDLQARIKEHLTQGQQSAPGSRVQQLPNGNFSLIPGQ